MTNKKGVSPMAAGIAAAVAGVAVGATAIALSNKKNRKKGQKAFSDFKESVEDLSAKTGEKVNEVKKTLRN